MISIKKYTEKLNNIWDDFILKSVWGVPDLGRANRHRQLSCRRRHTHIKTLNLYIYSYSVFIL